MSNKTAIYKMLATAVVYLALWLIVPHRAFLSSAAGALWEGYPRIAGLLVLFIPVIATAIFMLVQIAIIYFFSAIRMRPWHVTLCLLGSLVGVVILTQIMVWRWGIPARMGHWPGLQTQVMVLALYPGLLKMPTTLLTILAAASIGYLVSLVIKDRNLLLPVVMLAAYIDFWTVTRGPVAHVMEKAPEVVAAVSAPIPTAGAGSFIPVTMIGPGDFLFMALVFAVVHRFKLDGPRNFWFVYGTMTAGMLAVLLGLLSALPALTVLAVGVIAANWGKFKLSREEKISVAVVAGLLVVSLPVVWMLLRK